MTNEFMRTKDIWKPGEYPFTNEKVEHKELIIESKIIKLLNGEEVRFEVNTFADGTFVSIEPIDENSEIAKLIGLMLSGVYDKEGKNLTVNITKREVITIIDKEFIMKEDLRDWVFKEDSFGRYRERIMDEIKKIGVINWLSLKGYPITPESIWKNRYTGTEVELKDYLSEHKKLILEDEGYYLWENYLPKGVWTDKDLLDKYKSNSIKQQQEVKK